MLCKLFSADLWYLQLVKNVNSTLLRNHFWSSSLGFLCCFFLHRWKNKKLFEDLGSYNGSNFLKCVWDLLRMSWRLFFSEDDLSDEFFLRKCKNRLNNQAHTTWGFEKWSFLCVNIKPHFSLSYFFLMISFLCKKFYKSALFQ